MERSTRNDGVLIFNTSRSVPHEILDPSGYMVRPALFAETQNQPVAQDVVEGTL